MSSLAEAQRSNKVELNNANFEDTPSLQYSDEQLRALYENLFSFPPLPPLETPTDSPRTTLQSMHERFNLVSNDVPIYKAVIGHLQDALSFIMTDESALPKLGLVLDSEWEMIIKAALDVGDMEYALSALELVKRYDAELVKDLDLRLLEHPCLISNVGRFTMINDKLTQIGYPVTPERLSHFVNSHLHSRQPSYSHIKTTQDLIHKLEAQGTPPSQAGYANLIRAYLKYSEDSYLLSATTFDSHLMTLPANPSAAIAAVHDLFVHMRYVAYPTPSLETYSLVISACSRGHQVNPLRALELLQEVRDGLINGKPEFLQPELDTRSLVACYNGAIRACARAGPKFSGDAFGLTRELVKRDGIPVAGAVIGDIGPTRTTMTALMHSAKRTGDLNRTRWILMEVMRAQAQALGLVDTLADSEAILDEEMMACAFQAYSAYKPPFRRQMAQEAKDQQETESPSKSSESPVLPTSVPYAIPQSSPDVLLEVDALFSRIMSKRSPSPDPLFTHIPVSARIFNAYLNVYFSHASLEQALDKYSELRTLPGSPEPNAYSFVGLLERLAYATKSDRSFALTEAKKAWPIWTKWIERVEHGLVDPVHAEATPRAIERVWAAIIKIYSLCDEIDAALALLRDFITKYPPTNFNHQHHPTSSYRPPLEHAPSTNTSRNLSELLAKPAPRTGLLVRFTTPEQITEPGIAPHLLFTDLMLLHHRLVSQHPHRRADIAFLTWACKSYELQVRRHREQTLGVVKSPKSKPKEEGKRKR